MLQRQHNDFSYQKGSSYLLLFIRNKVQTLSVTQAAALILQQIRMGHLPEPGFGGCGIALLKLNRES